MPNRLPVLFFNFLAAALGYVFLAIVLVVPAAAQQFQFQTLGIEAGLSNLNVTSFLEDHAGVVWVGTQSGVFIANGDRFEKQVAFSAAGLEIIRALCEDSAGRIWALDSRHLVYLEAGVIHGISGLNLHITGTEGVALLPVPGRSNALYLLVDGHLLLVASKDGGRSWESAEAIPQSLLARSKELDALTSVTEATGSALWAGCGTKICRIDPQHATARIYGQAEGLPAATWQHLLVTRSGALWARSDHDLVSLAVGAHCFVKASALPGEASLQTQGGTIVEDAQGRILLNLAKGLGRLSDGHWSVFDQRNGMTVEELNTLMIDRAGSLWMAPAGHGVVHWIGYGEWASWTSKDGLASEIVWAVDRDAAGHLWITNEAGLDELGPGSNRITHIHQGGPFHMLRSVVVDPQQHVWTGDAVGNVFELDQETGAIRLAASGLAKIYQMLLDRQGRIWICSRAGLYVFSKDDNWKHPHKIMDPAVLQSRPWSLAEGPDGTLWLTSGAGLLRFDGQRWIRIHLPFPGGAAYNFMLAAAPDGTFWAQSKLPFPLLHLKLQGHSLQIIEKIDGGLIGSDNFTFLAVDRRGWLWIGSDDGVQVTNGSRWVQVTTEDGLAWDDTDFRSFLADPDGSVWIGTSGGLSHLLEPEKLFDSRPPKIQVARAVLGGQILVQSGRPKFDLRKPTLAVQLVNTNYARENATMIRYRLEGGEDRWQETSVGTLRFPALSPGSYTLLIEAHDRRNHLTSKRIVLSFIVLEPWWNRVWFHLVEGLGLFALFLVGWRASVHLLVRRQQELEALVSRRTQELEKEKAELLSARSALIEVAKRDGLTGLLNRSAIFERMGALCEVALASRSELAVVMADLDSFKRINDEFGHVVGDTVIRECAARIRQVVRPHDAVGRYGGEEILLLMPGLHPDSAPERLEALRMIIAREPIRHGSIELNVTCSFGVAWLGTQKCAIESLVNAADTALYAAKRNGRNRVEYALAYSGESSLLHQPV